MKCGVTICRRYLKSLGVELSVSPSSMPSPSSQSHVVKEVKRSRWVFSWKQWDLTTIMSALDWMLPFLMTVLYPSLDKIDSFYLRDTIRLMAVWWEREFLQCLLEDDTRSAITPVIWMSVEWTTEVTMNKHLTELVIQEYFRNDQTTLFNSILLSLRQSCLYISHFGLYVSIVIISTYSKQNNHYQVHVTWSAIIKRFLKNSIISLYLSILLT